ncbi:MAG: nucleoside kinase [Anaerolineales bacterium]
MIEQVEASNFVEVHFPDGRVLIGPRGTSVEEFLKSNHQEGDVPYVAAIVNSELHELTHRIDRESDVAPVTMSDRDGARIYRRSLTFLLEVTFSQLFPAGRLLIDHSVASGGYYCHVIGRKPLEDNELVDLKTLMNEYVSKDLPFIRKILPLEDARKYFEAMDYPDKVRLLAHRHKDYVTLYQLSGHMDYHHGYMVPSTGYLSWFDLSKAEGGFTLRFPQRSQPTKLLPLPGYPKLLSMFRQYGEWLERLGIDNVGALNDAICEGRTREVILVSEALHEQNIASIARQISEREDPVRLILVSGPSSSGKTTFARKLVVQLLAMGNSPFALELDNFFVDRDKSPIGENGEIDFEALETLDLAQLADKLTQLISGSKVQLPRYDFIKGHQVEGDLIQLNKDQIIILEGIHGLNPGLIPESLRKLAFRIYVSCLTQINLDRHNRVSTTDTRLIRRIVRDANNRGYSAAETINRWESVGRGESKHIFPFQENADVMFNSALVYELSAMVRLAEPLLRQVPYGTKEYIEAKRLLAFLEWFEPVETNLIPDNSLLREFVGGSNLENFKVWNG